MDVYAFDPVPEPFRGRAEERILGAQANLWTEYIPTPQKAEYMAYPRAVALAEVVWSTEENRNWFSFQGRLPAILERLDLRTVNYRRPGR